MDASEINNHKEFNVVSTEFLNPVKCPICRGTGILPITGKPCPNCRGRGLVELPLVLTEFMGKPVAYWVELENTAKMGGWDHAAMENSKLRAQRKELLDAHHISKGWNDAAALDRIEAVIKSWGPIKG